MHMGLAALCAHVACTWLTGTNADGVNTAAAAITCTCTCWL